MSIARSFPQPLSVSLDLSLFACLRAGWQAASHRYRLRRDLIRLSRLPPRLIRDAGFDPERVYKALDGTADAVGPAHLSPLLLRAEIEEGRCSFEQRPLPTLRPL